MAPIKSGQVLEALVLGVVASWLITWGFLAAYRRRVARTMREQAPAQAGAWVSSPVTDRPLPDPTPGAAVAHPLARLAVTYAFAFGLSSLVLEWPMMWELYRDSTDELGVLRALVVWSGQWAPIAIIIAAVVAATRRQALLALASVWAVGLLMSVSAPAALRLLDGRPLDSTLLANGVRFTAAFALNAVIPLALVYLTGRPRVRNVMPIMLAVVLPMSLALAAFNHWMAGEVVDLRAMNPVLEWAVLTAGATTGPALLFLIISLPVGWVGWEGVRILAERYRTRHFSNVQLVADAWWAVIVLFSLPELWNYGTRTALGSAAAAFVVYFVALRVALPVLHLPTRHGGPTLLLLRVFGFQKRTERLFDGIAERWRFVGPVTMIAGADLAMRSIDADEALAFARGEIESSYVADAADLARRLAALDAVADPDGRYRVDEFFCFENTWRATLRALLAHSRVVLMDLRGFTQVNRGCAYELEELAAEARLTGCVFVVDAKTDRELVASLLGVAGARPRWVSLSGHEASGMRELWRQLLAT